MCVGCQKVVCVLACVVFQKVVGAGVCGWSEYRVCSGVCKVGCQKVVCVLLHTIVCILCRVSESRMCFGV